MKQYFQVITKIDRTDHEYLIDFVPTKKNKKFINMLIRQNQFSIMYHRIRSDKLLKRMSFYKGEIIEEVCCSRVIEDGKSDFIDSFTASAYYKFRNVVLMRKGDIPFITIGYYLNNNNINYRAEIPADYSFGLKEISDFRVYNVGQGLLNTFGGGGKSAIFDFGSFSEKKGISHRLENFKNEEVVTIFISHPHSDHYNLIDISDYANLENLVLPICALMIGSTLATLLSSVSARAIKIYGIEDQPEMGYSVYSFRFRKGTMNLHFGKPHTSNVNSRGLLLYFQMLQSPDKFFTGDVYFEVMNAVGKHYNHYIKACNICAPHHGGNVGKTKLTNFHGGLAVCSYKPGYYRSIPNIGTVRGLTSSGFYIAHTCCKGIGSYYSI